MERKRREKAEKYGDSSGWFGYTVRRGEGK